MAEGGRWKGLHSTCPGCGCGRGRAKTQLSLGGARAANSPRPECRAGCSRVTVGEGIGWKVEKA